MSKHFSEPSQNHPLYLFDRDQIDRLLAKEDPQDADLIDLARLIIRYDNFPGAEDLQNDMQRILSFWSITRDDLNKKVRRMWINGFRPGPVFESQVGSGFDTSEREGG